MTCAKKNFKQILTLILIVSLVIPFPTIAASAPTKIQTLIMMPVGDSSESHIKDHNEIIGSIRKKLKSRYHFLNQPSTSQIKTFSKNQNPDPELDQAIHLMDDSLESYNRFNANAKETILAMDAVINYLNESVKPSAQASQLMITAIMTKAWLQTKSRQKDQARQTLNKVTALSPKSQIDLSYYPPAFRKFYKKTKETSPSGSKTLTVSSSPESVNVSINHIDVGVSPLTINLQPGTYTVGLYANGRKSVVKKAKLEKSDQKTIKAHLAWNGSTKPSKIIAANTWDQINRTKRLAFASQVSSAAQSDKTVFFNFLKGKKGLKPQAIVYDSNHSQFMKPIVYPKAIQNLETSHQEIASFFAKKLDRILKEGSVSYWSKNVDKEIIVDHHIASKGKKPFYKKPIFWVIATGVVAAATTTGILLSQGGSSAPKTGGIKLNLEGL